MARANHTAPDEAKLAYRALLKRSRDVLVRMRFLAQPIDSHMTPFRRCAGASMQLVWFEQRRNRETAGPSEFTINLDLCGHERAPEVDRLDPPWGEYQGRARIGRLLDEPDHSWWTLSGEPDLEDLWKRIERILRGPVSEWSERATTVEGLKALARSPLYTQSFSSNEFVRWAEASTPHQTRSESTKSQTDPKTPQRRSPPRDRRYRRDSGTRGNRRW